MQLSRNFYTEVDSSHTPTTQLVLPLITKDTSLDAVSLYWWNDFSRANIWLRREHIPSVGPYVFSYK